MKESNKILNIVGYALLVSGWISWIWLSGTLYPLFFHVPALIIFTYVLIVSIKEYNENRR